MSDFYLADGTWWCTKDGVTEPCGKCSGCREVAVQNRVERGSDLTYRRSTDQPEDANVVGTQPTGLTDHLDTVEYWKELYFEALKVGQEMAEAHAWDPDYVVPTSEVLEEWLEITHLSTRVAVAGKVAKSMKGEAKAQLDTILYEDALIGPREASLLALVTDIPFGFWLAFERNYRLGLAAGKHRQGSDTGSYPSGDTTDG